MQSRDLQQFPQIKSHYKFLNIHFCISSHILGIDQQNSDFNFFQKK
ncbi:hypothetical protein LEP1GSC074_3233 [Leptospira noguchii str. Hook]|uniref:Uncharacterized protein n=1 Tax=Leptospira noguchii serovar Autumnalis str. ZUN142 TaxID=1085540 RepID=M6U4U1_9LEPT|nr:hypothetical protein LEP1GSC186_1376 [Leptospira noguchii serovar Autumnalis str. ZUN142]EMS84805.1 hypothetical protein LEP1GSC074_3233 [Leptospira noguchii str. Hook]